ncbi:SNF2-related protein [Niveomyces insectorum RCEF 264]|uniref:SNF2-related protein n=1 Tax=Niveomyces insectorum RCEF 264 TaxID=1081102 RepID=A0A168AFR6_9HYPO|nr:SNF2-related protein [Niveomyces insectorum RCEF 264]
MARSRSASFSDDDLLIVSSQAMSSQGFGSQEQLESGLDASSLQPVPVRSNVIDITSSPVASATTSSSKPSQSGNTGSTGNSIAATRQPTFGRSTQMSPARSTVSSANQVKQQWQSIMFNTNKNRPEHHRPQRLTGPLAPKPPDRKAAPRPVFSSLGSSQTNGGTAYPVSSYYSNSSDAKHAPKPTTAVYTDVDFYTDPNKATEDLKALLEGGMEDDDDDEEDAKDDGKEANKAGQQPTETVAAKKEKKKPAEVWEDGTVPGITYRLLPHQVEGLRWMKGRELGPVKRGRVPKGGILADDMGLGKTLQALSLIVTNPKPEKDAPGWKKHYERLDGSTLVVAPLALIRQWEAEIKDKVSPDRPLRVCVHHGPQRTVRPRDLAQFDVVITTYQILVSEHGHSNDSLKSGCFGVNWYRVVLDEAHSIKNRNAKMTKACCALSAEFRWCLTGTPMQNNLDELQSLINFLRITPYDNLAEWRAHIDAPMKNGRGALAIRRLHSLLRCFMKRRTKDILTEEGALLPGGKKAQDAAAATAAAKDGKNTVGGEESSADSSSGAATPAAPGFKITQRNVVDVAAEFSPGERKFYDRLEERADMSLEKMMKGQSMNYANALVLLLRLRQACNHPSLLNLKLDKDKDALATDPVPASQSKTASVSDGDLDALADALGGLGLQTKKCEVCMSDLTKDEQEACESSDGLICTNCLMDQDLWKEESPQKEKKSKKDRKSKRGLKEKKKKKMEKKAKMHTSVKAEDVEEEEKEVFASRKAQRKPRNRRVLVDSDDEEEEADGSWLVGEKERGSLRLGKAGGDEDENAEGGGDWINSDDSIHHSEDEDDGSRLSGFVVDDEAEANKTKKKTRTVHIGDTSSEDDDYSDDDDCNKSVSSATAAGTASGTESDSDSESDSESDMSESEMMSYVDDDSLISARPGRPSRSQKNRMQNQKARAVLVSAKIRKLLALLREEAPVHKFIVFSQFTSMLDLLAPFVERAGWAPVRYDGRMRNDAREASLHRLRHDPATRVLLCSLKCGALGLNLTAATRVVLVEPFWNPFVEEQAIDRVHRLTQTVDVTVYKLTVADTVEQRILALQAKKRLLASQALAGGTSAGGGNLKGKKNALKLGLQELMDLFRHDARGGNEADAAVLGGGSAGDSANNGRGGGLLPSSGTPTPDGGGGLLRRRAEGSAQSTAKPPSQPSVYDRRW